MVWKTEVVSVKAALPVPRRKLGRRLRAMREAAGLTVDEAADKLKLSAGALSRMELGRAEVALPVARAMMDLYDQFEPEVVDLVWDARQPGWWQQDRWLDNTEYLAWESCAASVHEVAVARVPELLQVRPYAEALLLAQTENVLDQRVARMRVRDGVASRDVRRSRFGEHPMLRLFVVITERALRHRVGSQQVMVTQWDYLVQATQWAAVTLHVLPTSASAQPGQGGAFSLLTFADEEDPPQLYAARPGGLAHMVKAGAADRARDQFYRLCGASLSEAASVEFIERLIEDAGPR